MAVTQVLETDSLDQWRQKTNTVSTTLGDVAELPAGVTSVVGGVNNLSNSVGDLNNLTTADKSSLVSAVNEVKNNFDNLSSATPLTRPQLIAFA